MANQIDFYNEFGKQYREAILNSPDPSSWTSNSNPESFMNKMMLERTKAQENVVNKYFDKAVPVLDLGCGFGRQSFMMAKNGYQVTGVDNSEVFINIARDLFKKYNYTEGFVCQSVTEYNTQQRFNQVTLFDVIEHFPPSARKKFIKHLYTNICDDKAIVILTFPYMNENSIKDRIINLYKSLTFRFPFLAKGKEHPYPIPYKSTFENIITPYFTLIEYFHTTDTAFFVIKKN